MKIYIAGPMRGCESWNFPAFDAAAERWRAAGHQPFSPAQMDRALNYTPNEDGEATDGHLRHVLLLDVASVSAAEAIALLPGWERSLGATMELAVAQFLGLPVYDAITMELIEVLQRPWANTVQRCEEQYLVIGR